MRKTIIVLGATVCILVAAPLTFAVAITFTIFQVVLLIVRENWWGWLDMAGGGCHLCKQPAQRGLDVKAYTVYRYDYIYHAREPIGRVLERRRWERGNNYMDLLKLAQIIYSTSSLDSHVFLSPD